MRNRTIILILSICLSNLVYSQDFSFTWNISPSLAGRYYTVKINQNDSKREIQLRETVSKQFRTKKIDKKDCDSLFSFLCKYDFSDKGSNTIAGPKFREYIDIKWMPDSNWVILQNDTVRRDLLEIKYIYDKSQKKYYGEAQMMNTYTDGTDYFGEFITPNTERKFKIYCVRLTDKDYELNILIYGLVVKYFNERPDLLKMIESDRPRIFHNN